MNFAEFPWHVIQRGVNRSQCFADDLDRQRYWTFLKESSERHGCAVHAYVLMPNHIHLLIQSPAAHNASSMMKNLGQRYSQWFNRRHRRSGPLWEGRFHSGLVDTQRYLMICQRYIELNPVRASICERPDEFAWSSYRANALGTSDDVVSPHRLYSQLGPDDRTRQEVYRSLFRSPVTEEELIAIRGAANGYALVGEDSFAALHSRNDSPIQRRPRGRPPKPQMKSGMSREEHSAEPDKGVCPLF